MQTKDFTLAEIRTIAEKVFFIIGGQIGNVHYPGVSLRFGKQYSIGSWGKPFTDKATDIYKGQDKIILAYQKEGDVVGNNPEFIKEITEYLNTKDSVTYNYFNPLWLDDSNDKEEDRPRLNDVSILNQFVEECS